MPEQDDARQDWTLYQRLGSIRAITDALAEDLKANTVTPRAVRRAVAAINAITHRHAGYLNLYPDRLTYPEPQNTKAKAPKKKDR